MTVNPIAAALILGFFVLIFLARFVRRKSNNGTSPPSDPATIWLSSDVDRSPDRTTSRSTDQPLDRGPDAHGKGGQANDDPGTPDSDGDSDSGGGDSDGGGSD